MSKNTYRSNEKSQHRSNMDMDEIQLDFNNSQNQQLTNKEGEQNQNYPEGEEGELPEEERFFKDFTDMDIDNMDPSLEQNLIKIYEEDIPFEIRYDEEENKKNNFQSLLCKIFMTDEYTSKVNIKIELASNKDLFFYYTTQINSESFGKIKEEQKLTCEFKDLSDIFIKYLDLCINKKNAFLAVLNIKKEKAVLELYENFEFKCGELINLDFFPVSESLIRKQIIYRYNAMRATQDIIQNRINIINDVLKDVDPPLISEVKNEILNQKIDSNDNDKSKDNRVIKNQK